MLDMNALKAQDLQGLSQSAMVELATEMLAQITAMNALLQARDKQAAEHAQEIKFKDTKLERITHELARLKAWKFGAKTERMNAGQRQMFEETAAEDEASLQAQLLALQGTSEPSTSPAAGTRRQPRRQPLPEHLRRVEHRHEPENTTCPSPGCGRAMVRIGEDVSERLDIVPAEFFVQRVDFNAEAWLQEWLAAPLPAFGNRRPWDVLQEPEGLALIQATLLQIQKGSFA